MCVVKLGRCWYRWGMGKPNLAAIKAMPLGTGTSWAHASGYSQTTILKHCRLGNIAHQFFSGRYPITQCEFLAWEEAFKPRPGRPRKERS